MVFLKSTGMEGMIVSIRDNAACLTATGCLFNIVFFPLNFVIFLNSVSSAGALVFYLPSGKSSVHKLTPPRVNRERQESGIF